MLNRSNHLPAVYAASSFAWYNGPAHTPGPLEVFDVTYLHFHDTLEFGVCEEGAGMCRVEDTTQPFEAGDVQVIFPYQRHLSQSVGSVSSKWYWLNIYPLRVLPEGGMVEKLIASEMGVCGILKSCDYPELVPLIQNFLHINSKIAPCLHREETLRTLLQLIILRLADLSHDLPKLILRRNSRLDALSGTLDAMNQAIHNGCAPTVSELARLAGVSIATLRRLFISSVGQSPQEYISTCRMRRAQTLLYDTHDNITEIALSLGYEDVSGFNRAFLAHCGMSPSEFRHRAGKC